MPYKIVQTIEKGRRVLTAVPNEWENNGILYWPKKHEKLRRIENSLPDKNCRTINYILKRTNLSSFTQAELEIDNMSNFSDTETDNNKNQIARNYIKNPTSNENKIYQSYNEMALECCMEVQSQPDKENLTRNVTGSQNSQVARMQDKILIDPCSPQPVFINSDISLTTQKLTVIDNIDETPKNFELLTRINQTPQVFMMENNTVPASVQNATISNVIGIDEALGIILKKLDKVQDNVKRLSSEFKIITENQQTLFKNQNATLLKLSENQTQFEEFIQRSSINKSTEDNKTPDVKPIGSKKELQELELLLIDPGFEDRLRNTIKVVCSKGKNRGTNNAYALIDVLFQRSFLCQCSWAGGSRTTESKICIKSYTNIFDLFFSVIHESDPDFRRPDCEKFLKMVLKNSRQRCVSKQIRMSTTRHRQNIKKVTSTSPFKVSISEELLDQSKANGKEEKITTSDSCEGCTPAHEPIAEQSRGPSIHENSEEEIDNYLL